MTPLTPGCCSVQIGQTGRAISKSRSLPSLSSSAVAATSDARGIRIRVRSGCAASRRRLSGGLEDRIEVVAVRFLRTQTSSLADENNLGRVAAGFRAKQAVRPHARVATESFVLEQVVRPA